MVLLDREAAQHRHVGLAAVGIAEPVCRHPVAEWIAFYRQRSRADLSETLGACTGAVCRHLHEQHIARHRRRQRDYGRRGAGAQLQHIRPYFAAEEKGHAAMGLEPAK